MKFHRSVGLALLLLFLANPVFALWCGHDLIMEDQSTFEVRGMLEQGDCGEILAVERIGTVRQRVEEWDDPYFYPEIGFYGHHHRHGGYIGFGFQQRIGGIEYSSEKIEKWRIRLKNRQGISYCYDLIFRSGILKSIWIGEECSPSRGR